MKDGETFSLKFKFVLQDRPSAYHSCLHCCFYDATDDACCCFIAGIPDCFEPDGKVYGHFEIVRSDDAEK